MSERDNPQRLQGYGQPPRGSRFKKGQSGNPGGRPRGITPGRLANILHKEIYRSLTIKEGDSVIHMPAIRAIMRSQVMLAVKGNVAAQRAVIEMAQYLEQDCSAHGKSVAPVVDHRSFAPADVARRIVLILRMAAHDEAKKAEAGHPPGHVVPPLTEEAYYDKLIKEETERISGPSDEHADTGTKG